MLLLCLWLTAAVSLSLVLLIVSNLRLFYEFQSNFWFADFLGEL